MRDKPVDLIVWEPSVGLIYGDIEGAATQLREAVVALAGAQRDLDAGRLGAWLSYRWGTSSAPVMSARWWVAVPYRPVAFTFGYPRPGGGGPVALAVMHEVAVAVFRIRAVTLM